jgi:3-oxoacyl-[acyl-carrier-protein] synthase-3
MKRAVIHSTGSYAPERQLSNQYFNELLKEDVGTWLVENLTIRNRHWCDDVESTADLCTQAAKRAMSDGNIAASDLDLIIVATDTPEYISPSTASVVQHRLGADSAGAFDINAACAGFVIGLDMAGKYISADDRYRHILVIGAYAMSKYLDLTDKKTVTLFADGAGAVILKSSDEEERGFLASELISSGQYHDWMGIYAGGTNMPVSEAVLDRKDHLLKFVRKFPKEINPDTWTRMILSLTKRLKITPQDVDHFFFTQININSINETLDNIGVSHSKAHNIMDRYAYTGSACIPMAFDDAVQREQIDTGELIFFIGSGGGLAFASAAFRY